MEECGCRGRSEKEEDRSVKCRNRVVSALDVTLQYEDERRRTRGGGEVVGRLQRWLRTRVSELTTWFQMWIQPPEQWSISHSGVKGL